MDSPFSTLSLSDSEHGSIFSRVTLHFFCCLVSCFSLRDRASQLILKKKPIDSALLQALVGSILLRVSKYK